MPRRRKYRNRSIWYRYRVLFRLFAIFIAIGIGLAGAYLLSILGPQKIDPKALDFGDVEPADAKALLADSKKFEQQFVEISALREPNEEDMEVLNQAIAKQQAYKSALGGYDREADKRLRELQTLYQDTAASQEHRDSLTAERQAINLAKQGDFDQALKFYREAADIQRHINKEYPMSSRQNVSRLTQLDRKINELRAGPLWEASNEAHRRARAAADERDWGAAKEQLSEAIRLQKELNLEFRGLRYADVTRLSRLEVELASLESSDLHEEIKALQEKGETALAEKNYKVAAENLQAAARLQERLNDEHTQSRFASSKQADTFREMATDALSREVGDEIISEVAELDQSLRNREAWKASEIIPGLFDKAEAFKKSYPRSTLLTEELLLKLRFLKFIKDDIALLQDRIIGQLVPVPDTEGWHLTRIETPQALYRSVMLNNPSRNEGERLPVDSVNWDEAVEYCQKVSWILGLPTRLPTRNEFDASVGSLRYVNLNDISWNAQNSGDMTHEVGTKAANNAGFHDLLGNVGEWLLSGDLSAGGEAYIAGGNAEDSVDVLADVPVSIDNTRRRNRMTGFRIAVNLSPETEAVVTTEDGNTDTTTDS